MGRKMKNFEEQFHVEHSRDSLKEELKKLRLSCFESREFTN